VGNYAARCPSPLFDDGCGERTLTVLNSWDSGSNAITQTVTLGKGRYRLLLNIRCECPNLLTNDGRIVTTSGGNTCTSLTGVKIGSKTDYRYPTEQSSWERLVYDFELTAEQQVTFSLGFRTSDGKGAADNTLLYIDHVRLLKANDVMLRGDVNQDGAVDIADVVAVYNIMAGNNTSGFDGDVNQDGAVDIADVVAVYNIMAGKN
jgi:hypothetical protein